MKILLIYNNNAGGGRAGKIYKHVLTYLEAKDISVDTLFTEYLWHGIELVKNTNLDAYDAVIASGGDGTLFEVLNGYMVNESSHKPPIGLIPNGTGNAFAKELNLKSFEWEKAIDIIAGNKPKKIDIASLITGEKTYYYMNMLGLGWSADVGKTVIKLKFLGEVSYLLGVLYHILFLKSVKTHVEMDGQKLQREAVFVHIGNTRYTGSKFIMSPDAIADDGFLEVIILNKLSRLRILKILPTIFNGKHILEKEVEIFKAKHISVSTEKPKLLIPDGEIFGTTPIEVHCLPKELSFFWPE